MKAKAHVGAWLRARPRLFWSLVMVALCIYFIAGAKHVVRLVFREAPKEGQNAES